MNSECGTGMEQTWGRHVVIVGSGPVGMRTAGELTQLSPHSKILLINDEKHRPYDRVRLSSFVARELPQQDLYDRRLGDFGPNVGLRDGCRVTAIDRESKTIEDDSGLRISYDALVLATGSQPFVPPIPGSELPGVFVFRDMKDAEQLLARQVSSRSTLVIGGGLLGLEAARAMRRFNTRVHVVEHEQWLMFNQLDEAAAGVLAAHVTALGIDVHTGTSVQQIVGTSRPGFVRLRDGTEIECDTVVLATGIRPNIELARAAGLAVGRGIRVNDTMQTSDPSIYAVGECAEHRDSVYGLVGPGLEQAAVAASHISGRQSAYIGSIAATSLKVVGVPVVSIGEIQDSVRPFRAFTYRDSNNYRRLNISRGRIIGAVGVGAWDVARLRSAGIEGARVWPWQLWRFRRSGSPWPAGTESRVATWPESAIVCNCRGVTRGTLSSAMAGGATGVAALASLTGASTVCGSCRPLLVELAGATARPEPIRRWLLGGSAAGAIAAVAAVVVALPYSASVVYGTSLDVLWTSSTSKQISGYSLLALALVISALSLRKRLPKFQWLNFAGWQVFHVAVGLVAAVALLAHTGFRFGANLNAWLMGAFVGLIASGALAGVATACAGRSAARRLRPVVFWSHVVLLWPLAPLLGFHVLKSYWF